MPNKRPAVLNPQLEMANQTTIHTNLKQDIICTTKDKLHLELQTFRDAIESIQKFATYGGIALSILLSLVTSTPQETFGLSADIWKAVFVMGLFLSVVAAIVSLVKTIQKSKNRDIEQVCKNLMTGINTTDSDEQS